MPYVDHRWLGGMLTNFKTVKALDQAPEGHGGAWQQDGTLERMSKKEALMFQREMRQARAAPSAASRT